MAALITIFLIGIVAFSLVSETVPQTHESYVVDGVLTETEELAKGSQTIDILNGSLKKKRSPQFYEAYDDYTDSRSLSFSHRRKKHRRPQIQQVYYGAGHGGCRGYGCPHGQGWRPQQVGYHQQGPQGGQSFASASAGSGSFQNGGSQSHANSQSATFSLGPYTASFSHAEASAGNRNHRPPTFFDY